MDTSKILAKAGRAMSKVGFYAKKYSPELFMILGIGTAIGGTIVACIATTKVDTVLDKTKNDLDVIHKNKETADTKELVEANRKDLVAVYGRTGWELTKLYAPAVGLMALSMTSFLASNQILKKRYVAMCAAYATTTKSFDRYRNGVVERYGEEVDQELLYGLKKHTIIEQVVDENGEVHTVSTVVDIADPNMPSPFARYFTPKNFYWEDGDIYNEAFFNNQQRYANDLLRAKGYVYINTIYEMMGLKQSSIGQLAGWRYRKDNPDGDNYIQFIVKKVKIPKSSDPEDGYEDAYLIDFNVDGNILEKMSDDDYFEC